VLLDKEQDLVQELPQVAIPLLVVKALELAQVRPKVVEIHQLKEQEQVQAQVQHQEEMHQRQDREQAQVLQRARVEIHRQVVLALARVLEPLLVVMPLPVDKVQDQEVHPQTATVDQQVGKEQAAAQDQQVVATHLRKGLVRGPALPPLTRVVLPARELVVDQDQQREEKEEKEIIQLHREQVQALVLVQRRAIQDQAIKTNLLMKHVQT